MTYGDKKLNMKKVKTVRVHKSKVHKKLLTKVEAYASKMEKSNGCRRFRSKGLEKLRQSTSSRPKYAESVQTPRFLMP